MALVGFFSGYAALEASGLIMGLLHRDDCPIQDKVPLFLIVSSTSTPTILVIFFMLTYFEQKSQKRLIRYFIRCIMFILISFITGWTVYGTYLLASIRPDFKNVLGEDYCSRMIYVYSWCAVLFKDVVIFCVYIMFYYVCKVKPMEGNVSLQL